MTWATQCRNCNWGLVTGAKSGLVILDEDPAHGGTFSLDGLRRSHGVSMPSTPTVRTGGEGRHYVFRHPGHDVRCSIGKLAQGLDVRGDGGYVVLVGSLHVSGNHYRWLVSPDEVDMADVPEWILECNDSGDSLTERTETTENTEQTEQTEEDREDRSQPRATVTRRRRADC